MIFNGDFVVKNFARTGIPTLDFPTRFFFIAAAPSIQALAFSWSRWFQAASTLGDLAVAALAANLVASNHIQSLKE